MEVENFKKWYGNGGKNGMENGVRMVWKMGVGSVSKLDF